VRRASYVSFLVVRFGTQENPIDHTLTINKRVVRSPFFSVCVEEEEVEMTKRRVAQILILLLSFQVASTCFELGAKVSSFFLSISRHFVIWPLNFPNRSSPHLIQCVAASSLLKPFQTLIYTHAHTVQCGSSHRKSLPGFLFKRKKPLRHTHTDTSARFRQEITTEMRLGTSASEEER